MKLYDIPVNFQVYGRSEDDAISSLFHTLRLTVDEEDPEVKDYELFEFIPTDCKQTDGQSCCGRCGNDNIC